MISHRVPNQSGTKKTHVVYSCHDSLHISQWGGYNPMCEVQPVISVKVYKQWKIATPILTHTEKEANINMLASVYSYGKQQF